MKKKLLNILFLDDSPEEVAWLVNDLQMDLHNINVVNTVNDFINYLFSKNPIDLIILDVMMPECEPIQYNDYTYQIPDPLRAGVYIAKLIRELEINIPIILFSSAWNPNIIEDIKTLISDDSNIAYVPKFQSNQLKEFITSFANNGKIDTTTSLIKIIGKSLILKPSFFGIGLDFEKLIKIGFNKNLATNNTSLKKSEEIKDYLNEIEHVIERTYNSEHFGNQKNMDTNTVLKMINEITDIQKETEHILKEVFGSEERFENKKLVHLIEQQKLIIKAFEKKTKILYEKLARYEK